jgi:CRP-like cAMP-binding protein
VDSAAARAHFRSLIRRLVDFTESDWTIVLDALRARDVAAGATLLHAGDVCGEVAFIHGGMFRTYIIDDGKDVTCDFRMEGDFVTDYVSFLLAEPSAYSIVAIEAAQILTLDRTSMQELYRRVVGGERLGRLIAERLFVEAVSRTTSFVTQRPLERYRSLVQQRPTLLQRVNQLHLATYLGVTPESLSRIRRRLTGSRRRPAVRRRQS